MRDNQEKTVLITGAAGGIGQALVGEFHKAGYEVIAADRVTRPGHFSYDHYLQIDLASLVEDEDYAKNTFIHIRELLGGRGLNALVNNAAVQILGGVDSLTRGDWRQTLDVNLIAPFLVTQALLHELEGAKGSVVNISSIHAKLTKKNFVAYATSKAALSAMTKALAVDLGPRVRVNAIEPAAVETGMLKASFEGKPELYRQLEACHPQGRVGQPEEVARLALAIVESGMNFLQGACIGIDGGIANRLFDPG